MPALDTTKFDEASSSLSELIESGTLNVRRLPRKQLASFLDALVREYKTPAFIPDDPISIPHRFIEKGCSLQEVEMVAFITTLLSYGRRDLIIKTVNTVFERMENDPYNFVMNYNPKKDHKAFDGFIYRFYKPHDMAHLMQVLKHAYTGYENLETLFSTATQADAPDATLKNRMANFLDVLLGLEKPRRVNTSTSLPLMPNTYGTKFMFAHPDRGGPCKRLHMFLRWVVRDDTLYGEEKVDLGLWKTALKPSELLIPYDTHVSKMSQILKLTKRNTASWDIIEEITAKLRHCNPDDPMRYDFALMGLGLSGLV